MTNLFDDPWREYDELDEFDELEFERPGLSLSLEQQVALSAAVDAQLRTLSCDGTLRGARQWARSAEVDWRRLQRELEENGGYCDCEIVLNVFGGDLDRIFDDGG